MRRILHTSHVHQENGNLYVLPPLAREKYHNAFRIEVPRPLSTACTPVLDARIFKNVVVPSHPQKRVTGMQLVVAKMQYKQGHHNCAESNLVTV